MQVGTAFSSEHRILIVGAGVSGLSAARMLSDRRLNVDVVEGSSRVGGLISCTVEEGYLFHRVGGHVFNSKDQKVLEWFWSIFDKDKDFFKVRRNAQILLGNRKYKYPIENHIFQFEANLARQIIFELLELPKIEDFLNFKDFLRYKFGETLCELYFYPYNEKIWQSTLEDISVDWLHGKLPSPSLAGIFESNILRNDQCEMPHSWFYYPKRGGSQFIVEGLAQGLEIAMKSKLEMMSIQRDGIKVNGKLYDRVIYTGDIRDLHQIIVTDDNRLQHILKEVSDIPSHGTSNLLCECDPTDLSWLYLPDRGTAAHRIIYTGGFSSANNAAPDKSSCVVEFTGYLTESEMLNEALKLPGIRRGIASNYTANSYVMHTNETKEKVGAARQALESLRIHLLGRFAEWEYYNMDTAIRSAMLLVSKF